MWWLCGSRATVPPRTLWGALGALVLPVQTGIGSSSYFPGGNWEAFGSREREDAPWTGIVPSAPCRCPSVPLPHAPPAFHCYAQASLLLLFVAWVLSIWDSVQGG